MSTTEDILDIGSREDPRPTINDNYAVIRELLALALEGTQTFTGARALTSGTQAIPDGTATAIEFASTEYDEGGFFDSDDATRLTVAVGKGGWYDIVGRAQFQAHATEAGYRILEIRVNGTDIKGTVKFWADTNKQLKPEVTSSIPLADGDYIELVVETGVTTTNDIYDAVLQLRKVGVSA